MRSAVLEPPVVGDKIIRLIHAPPANVAGSLLIQLATILAPLDLAALFPGAQPLEVELGCGDASFLAEYARTNPQKNFLGVERLLGRLQKLDKKGRRLGLQNTRGLRIESGYFLQYLLPRHAAFEPRFAGSSNINHRSITAAWWFGRSRRLARGGPDASCTGQNI